jgi:N-formylglutamate deformylase
VSVSQAAEPLYDYMPGERPLLLSFPHSGTFVPPDLAMRLTPEALDLPDTDWYVPELYHFTRELGASVICATHTRYVVDLNRPPDGAPLYPGQRETTVCPTETFDGERLYAAGQEPTSREITERLHRYWQPYHDKLAELAQAIVRRHGYCILWDAHSIHSVVPALFEGRLPDLNIGSSGGRSCSPDLPARLIGRLSSQSRFSHVLDGRFKGGYITRHYGNPAANIHAVQMEIAQGAYLQESRTPDFSAARAQPLSSLLKELLQAVLDAGSPSNATSDIRVDSRQ